MATTAFTGPVYVFGQAATPPGSGLGVAQDSNPHRGPSMFDQGQGIMDPRYPTTYLPGGGTSHTYGWFDTPSPYVVNQVPSTATTNAIAAAQVPVAATPLTLVTVTGAGITAGVSITNASTGLTVTGLLAIDGAMGAVTFGSSGGGNFWDPTKALARTVQIQSLGNDSAATATVRGYDVYNYPMSETITLANIGTAVGKKAFKYVASITPAGTLSGSNVSAGQSDTIGFMIRSDLFQYLVIYWPDTTLIASNTGYVAAVTTTATSTTGDVRGTYALQTASNAVRRLVVSVSIPVANIGTAAGIVGVTQA